MSGLSEERRAALTERLEWCRRNASSAPHYSIRDMRDTLEELFAESAALRMERDEAVELAAVHREQREINAKELLKEMHETERLRAAQAPASPDDLARVAAIRERLHRHGPSLKYIKIQPDDIAFLLARLTPPTGPRERASTPAASPRVEPKG